MCKRLSAYNITTTTGAPEQGYFEPPDIDETPPSKYIRFGGGPLAEPVASDHLLFIWQAQWFAARAFEAVEKPSVPLQRWTSLFTSIQSIHIGFDETKLSQEPRVAYHVLGHVATRRRGCQFQLSVRAHAHECKSSKVTLPLLVPATREITAGNAGIRF